MLKAKFNPAAGWIVVWYDTPRAENYTLIVPPGLREIYQKFYGASVTVIENQRLPE